MNDTSFLFVILSKRSARRIPSEEIDLNNHTTLDRAGAARDPTAHLRITTPGSLVYWEFTDGFKACLSKQEMNDTALCAN